MDVNVGEPFKVGTQLQTVTVDGYVNPSSLRRFCLGQLTNVHRTQHTERARTHVGKGIQLVRSKSGGVWIRTLTEYPVFIQSFHLDRKACRLNGAAVHKIYPNCYIKIFDLRRCHQEMWRRFLVNRRNLQAQLATMNQGQNMPRVQANMAIGACGVDDLRKLCVLRLSFVKGWGSDYLRKNIKQCPCWIEVTLNEAMKHLDKVLLQNGIVNILPVPSAPQINGAGLIRPPLNGMPQQQRMVSPGGLPAAPGQPGQVPGMVVPGMRMPMTTVPMLPRMANLTSPSGGMPVVSQIQPPVLQRVPSVPGILSNPNGIPQSVNQLTNANENQPWSQQQGQVPMTSTYMPTTGSHMTPPPAVFVSTSSPHSTTTITSTASQDNIRLLQQQAVQSQYQQQIINSNMANVPITSIANGQVPYFRPPGPSDANQGAPQ